MDRLVQTTDETVDKLMSLLELPEALVGHAMILTCFSPHAFPLFRGETLLYSEKFADMM